MEFKIESPAFKNGDRIPERYTCDGEEVSPPIDWSGVPEGTASLLLICEDPDAPSGTWDHWILANLDPMDDGVQEAIPNLKVLPGGKVHGLNTSGRANYEGPCPPRGKPHRYFFRLYALNSDLGIAPGLKKGKVMDLVKGHILAQAELMGTYSR